MSLNLYQSLARSSITTNARTNGILVHLLDGRPLSKATQMHPKAKQQIVDGYQIFYTGIQDQLTPLQDVTNPEWIFSYYGQVRILQLTKRRQVQITKLGKH